MAELRASVILWCVVSLGVTSGPTQSRAEWWKTDSPKDFEDCASAADQPNIAKNAKADILASCDSKFAGRRKASGGYTYFDFMQNRAFDIAGPNPTQDELKQIDQEYLGYLEEQRKTAILAAFTQQKQQPQVASLQQRSQTILKRTVPQQAALKRPQQHSSLQKPVTATDQKVIPRPPADLVRVRKNKTCGDALSCGWTKLTMTMGNLRESLLASAPKANTRAD